MGDQDMATFDDADWSEDSCMDECDPGALLANQASSDWLTFSQFQRDPCVFP